MSLIQKAKDKRRDLDIQITHLTRLLLTSKAEVEELRREIEDLNIYKKKYSATLDENIRLTNQVEELNAALSELSE